MSVQKFLSEIGLNELQIATLQTEGADIDAIVTEWQEQNKALVKTKFDMLEKDEVQNRFTTFSKGAIKKVARLVGMELTDAQANKIALDGGIENFVKEAEIHLNNRITELQTGTDEKLKGELNTLLTQKAELANQIDSIRNEYETKLQETERTWEQKYTQKEVDAMLDRAFSKIAWADPDMSEVSQFYLRQKMSEMGIKVNPDGTVTRTDGTNALSLSGKSIYKSILSDSRNENPLLDIAYEKNLIKVSNGGQGSNGTPPAAPATPNAGELKGAAAEMAARFKRIVK